MWRLPITFILVTGIESFVILPSKDIYNLRQEFWEADNKERRTYKEEFGSEQDEIWLLDVLPGEQKLRRASDEESKFFESSFGDIIEIAEQRRSLGYIPRRPKAIVAQNITDGISDKAVLELMRTAVNKFVLSSLQDREQNLEDSYIEEVDPSITLYIKTPYSGIIISYGDRQWNFFLRPPSPLPVWLYESHSQTDMDVKKQHPSAIGVKKQNPSAMNVKKQDSSAMGVKKQDPSAMGVKKQDPSAMGVKKQNPSAEKDKSALHIGSASDYGKDKNTVSVRKNKTFVDVKKYKSDMEVGKDKKIMNIVKDKTAMDVGKSKTFMGVKKSDIDVTKDKTATDVGQSKDDTTVSAVKETSYNGTESFKDNIGSTNEIQVPKDVQSALYRALLRYIKTALRFDLS